MAAALLIGCLAAGPARAATINAASCSQAAVQAAVNMANAGDTVTIPVGTCTWVASVSVIKGITIQGAGQGATVINGGGSSSFMDVNLTGGDFRLTALTYMGPWTGRGALNIDGVFTSLRIDHLTITDISPARAVVIGYQTWYRPGAKPIQGLLDHITYSNTQSVPFALYYGTSDSWMQPDNFGSANAMFIEDSSFSWTTASWSANSDAWDNEHGGRFVFRHNTVTCGSVLVHDTGSTQQSRGTRAFEEYANVFNGGGCSSPSPYEAVSLRGGTGLLYDNSVNLSATQYGVFSYTEIWRLGQASVPWSNACDSGNSIKVCSNGRSFCSGSHTPCGAFTSAGSACTTNEESGAGSGTCTNLCTQDSDCPAGYVCMTQLDNPGGSGTGYPCRDQTGRGQDGTDAAHTQALSPVYLWNNVDSNAKQTITTNYQTPYGQAYNIAATDALYIQLNRDVYATPSATFDGTAGVGRGTLSGRPNACTPGVAYWATDTNTLYQCSSSPPNTWTVYYTPYAYPHPLQNAGSGGGGGGYSACDLNQDNSTNVIDVQLEINMALGVTSCTGDINQDGSCNVIDVQRVVNAALGGQCVTQ